MKYHNETAMLNKTLFNYKSDIKKIISAILLYTICFCSSIVMAQHTVLRNFAVDANGRSPYGSLISDGTYLYGMTLRGGINNKGTVFKIKSDGTGYAKLLDFADSTYGSFPWGSLISDGTFLYGMTNAGGINGDGTVFKIKLDGTGYSRLLDFDGTTNGDSPLGSLFSDGTFLYGMTSQGGTSDDGTIFKLKLDGTSYLKLLDFVDATKGSLPRGSLISDGTYLYGMTEAGGSNQEGTLFKIKTDGSDYQKLLDFAQIAYGRNPKGSLIFDGTFLYGTTSNGGVNDYGTVFKIKPDGTGYSRLLDFAGSSNGRSPFGSLIFNGTFLYGMTFSGGSTGNGTLFKIKTDGSDYEKLQDFAGTANGSNPWGSLISDGNFFYGMTEMGGTYGSGTVFKYKDSGNTGILPTAKPLSINLFPNPFTRETTLQMGYLLQNIDLRIYNAQGQIVEEMNGLSGRTFKITRNNFPVGLYFLHLIENNRVIAADKLIITD